MPAPSKISRAQVLRAARELLREGGAASLTMRRLATRLGCRTPSSLYRYLPRGKDGLHLAVLELTLSEVELPDVERLGWREWVRELSLRLLEALRRDGVLVGLFLGGRMASPAGLRLLDAFLDCLTRAGFDASGRHLAYHVLLSHLRGRLAEEALAHGRWTAARTLGHPHVAAMATEFARCDELEQFRRGVDAITAGLEATRARPSTARRGTEREG